MQSEQTTKDVHIDRYDCANNRDEPLVPDGPILWIRRVVGAVPCYHICVEGGFRMYRTWPSDKEFLWWRFVDIVSAISFKIFFATRSKFCNAHLLRSVISYLGFIFRSLRLERDPTRRRTGSLRRHDSLVSRLCWKNERICVPFIICRKRDYQKDTKPRG
jgi:hypothetical protein